MEKKAAQQTRSYKPKNQVIPEFGKLQPQAVELEEAVLGALMLEKDAYSVISDLLKPDCFYEHKHQLIYSAVVDLASKQEPIDMLTVTEQLRRNGKIDEVGGPFYIAQLTAKVASAAHIDYHARIVAQKYLARELISFSSNVQKIGRASCRERVYVLV